jgi:1-acyl-sn-glycerol-3-phosphate acyltransferase
MPMSKSGSPESQDERLERLRQRAVSPGVSLRLYALVRAVLTPSWRLWFRLRCEGVESVPASGPAIITPNHKSFFDTFFIGIACPRPVRFMAKSELMEGWAGPLLVRLGAFPVRRGSSDAEAIETARTLLRQGEVLVIFPEGTRVADPHALGAPHRGAGRLSIEERVPMVPCAITGTQSLWVGPFAKPRRVQMAFSDPVLVVPEHDDPASVMDERVWPEVRLSYSRLLARPGLALGALAALGVGSGLLARRRAQAVPHVVGVVAPLKDRKRARRRRRRARLGLARRS